MQCHAVCCRVLQCVAVIVQFIAVCYSVLQCVAVCCSVCCSVSAYSLASVKVVVRSRVGGVTARRREGSHEN